MCLCLNIFSGSIEPEDQFFTFYNFNSRNGVSYNSRQICQENKVIIGIISVILKSNSLPQGFSVP